VRIVLIGYGKMGQMVERMATAAGHEVTGRFKDVEPLKPDAKTAAALQNSDVLVDFSSAEAVLENVRSAAALGLPLVEGTTGWQADLDAVLATVSKAGIGFVHGSNFSLGANLFYRLVEQAGRILASFGQYDPFIEEAHHKFKKDAPSGTALELAAILGRFYPGSRVPVSSLRAGFIPGIHAVGFDSAVDTIRLEHTARSREGLAQGALLAASWILGKRGVFHFRDIIDQLIAEASHEKT
jgi:4-hydroxy-tetrahydrodipicolinate reductase